MEPVESVAPGARPLWNPYVAGVALGLVLLGSFLVMGFGLGASGATNRLAIGAAWCVAPQAVEKNAYFGQYAGPGKKILDDWLIFEVLGVLLGGFLASYSGGRLKLGIQKGPRIGKASRLGMAILGGVLMGIAARLARGCASGQALTGGGALSLGSWIFMMMFFAGAYMFAPLLKKQWR
jgi:uncharacterized protein